MLYTFGKIRPMAAFAIGLLCSSFEASAQDASEAPPLEAPVDVQVESRDLPKEPQGPVSSEIQEVQGATEAAPPVQEQEEQKAPEEVAPEPTPAPEVKAPDPEVPPAAPKANPSPFRKMYRPDEVLFGRYKVRVGVAKPKYTDTKHLKCYKQLYGTEPLQPTIGVDVYAYDWYVTFGASIRAGYSTQYGFAAKAGKSGKPDNCDEVEIELDKNEKTTLTVVPLQAMAVVQFTPFAKKWVVFDGWMGMNYTRYEETRIGVDSEAKTTTGTSGTSGSTPKSGAQSTLTNKGFRREVVVGGAANILLNAFDERSVSSMRSVLGLGAIYAAPYLEIAKAQNLSENEPSFDRTTVGISFTFESAR